MIKSQELTNPESCLNKAADDEPIFVFRAKDAHAPAAIVAWAAAAKDHHEPEKIKEALLLAEQMRLWRMANVTETDQ